MIAGFIASFPWFTVPGLPWYGLLLAAVMGLGCGWPCCGCEICADDWTGIGDGTDVSTGTACGWTEDAGSWSVTSNAVTTTSSSAILRSNTAHPDGTGEQSLSVSLKSSASNDLIRVIVGYVDSSNYHFAEVKTGASGYLKIFKRSAGSNTELDSISTTYFAAGTARTLTVCINDAQTTITATTPNTAVCGGYATTVPASADEFGLGTGGTVTGTVTFDDFTATSTASDCPDCDGCCEFCTIPSELQVTQSGWANSVCPVFNDCPSLDSTAILQHASVCIWDIAYTPFNTCGVRHEHHQIVITSTNMEYYRRDTGVSGALMYSATVAHSGDCSPLRTMSVGSAGALVDGAFGPRCGSGGVTLTVEAAP